MPNDVTPVSQQDFLEQDPPIRGQKYACVSFVSPEDVLQRKDVFQFQKFLAALTNDVNDMLTRIDEKYAGKDDGFVRDLVAGIRERHAYLASPEAMKNELDGFVAANAEAMDRDFNELEGFRTSVRGFKIRGAYETLDEAKARALKIRSFDDKFNVFVAQVGCWCPWSPNPEEIADNEYAEAHLNTLVKNYKTNETMKNEFYEKRKTDFIEKANEENEMRKKNLEVSVVDVSEIPAGAVAPCVSDVAPDVHGQDDPWLARKADGIA